MAKAYVICDIEVTDPVAYEEYKGLAGPAVERHSGRYIVRGGATDVLEGDREPNRVVVVEFPSVESAKTWYDSDDYVEARRAREGAANARLILVEGTD